MSDRTRAVVVVAVRTLVVLTCIVVVIVARASTGWPALFTMLAALGVLIGVLWTYRPRHG